MPSDTTFQVHYGGTPTQLCGLRPSVLGQDRSETQSQSWSWSCRSGVVLWNTVL